MIVYSNRLDKRYTFCSNWIIKFITVVIKVQRDVLYYNSSTAVSIVKFRGAGLAQLV